MKQAARCSGWVPSAAGGSAGVEAAGQPIADAGSPGPRGAPILEKDVGILLVGNHAPLMGFIKERLGKEPRFCVLGIAHTAESATATLAKRPADLVLIDIDAAGDGHWEVARAIRAAAADLHILFLSGALRDQDIEQALAVGARGLVLKHDLPGSVLTAIHEVLDGGCWFPEEVRSRIVVDATGVRLAPAGD